MLEQQLRNVIRDVPDFPRPGILFKDITPVLADVSLRRQITDAIALNFAATPIDAVAGIEARGFIIGALLAERLGVPFVPIRKAGRLPGKTLKEAYDLEYGSASMEVQADAFGPGRRILLHDDLLATGGTAAAAGRLVARAGAVPAGFSFIIRLSFLPGMERLEETFGMKPYSLISFEN
jgi:adenine phosphoribosyltransferase